VPETLLRREVTVTETRVYRAAMTAVVVAIAGTGGPASGRLVPIALAVVLALVYPGLPAGARALLALICGGLAVTAGLATWAGPFAVVSTAAGAALLALGSALGWRTRRLDEPRPRRYARRALVGLGLAVVLMFVALPVGIAIVVNHRAQTAVAVPDLGRPHHDVTLRTSDDLSLAASYVPSLNGAAVIVFPGRRAQTVRHARLLVRHGYGVLVLDRRGEGESDGNFNSRGWGGEPDLVAALDFLAHRRDVDHHRIGGLGLSVGGELLLQTAAHDPRLRAIVSDGAGLRSFAEQLHWPGVPKWRRWLSAPLVETAAGIVFSGRRPPPDLVDVVGRIAPRHVLLIRALEGNADEVLNRVYRDAAPDAVRLWEVPTAGHVEALAVAPAEYELRVIGFFDQELES
jgi:hypothetical protein